MSPASFEKRPVPRTPHDLAEHQCINLRFLSGGGLYAWALEKDGREVRVRVDGQLIFSNVNMIVRGRRGIRAWFRYGGSCPGAFWLFLSRWWANWQRCAF